MIPNRITIFLEPTADCNLRCRHCYHADTGYDIKRASEETIVSLVDKLSLGYDRLRIVWHGGEPLLMGLDFFKKTYEIFEENSKKHKRVFEFDVQTNGTLIDEEFAEFFKKTNTTVSVSYDGPYNEVLRQQTELTEESIKLLKLFEVKLVCISTISSQSIAHIVDIYEFFKEQQLDVKFNPVFASGEAKRHQEYVVSKEAWAEAFIRLLDYWLLDKDCNIRTVSCESILRRFIDADRSQIGCPTSACILQYLALDAYGNLYPCARLTGEDFLLCNIKDIVDVRQAYLMPNYLKLKEQVIERVSFCKKCKWFSRCRGGCSATANIEGKIENANEFDCYFSNKIFTYLEKRLKETKEIKNPRALKILNREK